MRDYPIDKYPVPYIHYHFDRAEQYITILLNIQIDLLTLVNLLICHKL